MKRYILRKNARLLTRADWTKGGTFEKHLARNFSFEVKGNHTIKFRSIAEAHTAFTWIKDEYPEYKNRITISGLTIQFLPGWK